MKARAVIEFYDDHFNIVKKHITELTDLEPEYINGSLEVYSYEIEVKYADIKKKIHEISDISEVNHEQH